MSRPPSIRSRRAGATTSCRAVCWVCSRVASSPRSTARAVSWSSVMVTMTFSPEEVGTAASVRRAAPPGAAGRGSPARSTG